MSATSGMERNESRVTRPDNQIFYDAFRASPIGMAVENLEGQPLFVNPALCSMLGFSEEELRNKHCVQFSPPEDAEKDWALFQQLRAGTIDHYQIDKRYFRRDGSLVWGRLSISLVNSRPSPLVVALVEDITERRTAEDALREGEERLRLAAQVGKMYAFSWDVATDEVVRSSEYSAILGVGSHQALRRSQFVERVHPEDRAKFIAAVSDLTPSNSKARFIYRVLRSDGSVIWLEENARAFFDTEGKMLRLVGMVADVSERKLAEQEFALSNERSKLAMEAAGIGGWDFDLVSRRHRWFGKAHAQLGMTPDDDTSSQAFWGRVHPSDSDALRSALQDAKRNHTDFSHEFRVLRADGTIHWLHSMGRYYYSAAGEPERMLGVSVDVTERKRAEEELSDMTRKLVEAQEQERARIGRELHDDISQRLAMLAIELEQLQHNPSDVGNRLRDLQRKTSEISSDAQALSHELHPSRLEYLGAVAGIRGWCAEFGERQGMEVRFRSDVSNPLPFEIGLCLFRVVQEALHNVLKHSGVKQIQVQLTQQSNEVDLRVSDSGRGFNVEAGAQGQGLGLTSMRERVRLVNGTIKIESMPAGGTTIRVHVPLTPQAGQRAAG